MGHPHEHGIAMWAPQHINPLPADFSVGLTDDASPGRLVVRAEEQRLELEVPDGKAEQAEVIQNLDDSRTFMTDAFASGEIDQVIDAVMVDSCLGLRTNHCILPSLLQEQHHDSEKKAGGEIPFLGWMAIHASDTQLLNVWQWHDHYLREQDNDPEFRQRAATVKASYAEGIQQAITAGTLHPNLAMQDDVAQQIRIVHASPLSPAMASMYTVANRPAKLIQVREGVTDFMLYHQIAHLQAGGLQIEFNEGMTELIAMHAYNNSHPEGQQIGMVGPHHYDQILTLEALQRMTRGQVGLYELSGIYAGPDSALNTARLVSRIDQAIGFPLTLHILKYNREIFGDDLADNKSRAVHRAARLNMQHVTQLLEKTFISHKDAEVQGFIDWVLRLNNTTSPLRRVLLPALDIISELQRFPHAVFPPPADKQE